MLIRFSKRFSKHREKADIKIKFAFGQRLKLFKQDSFHPLLNNHQLTGKYSGYRSINITGDWRALYREEDEDGNIVIIFEVMGTHSQLYK